MHGDGRRARRADYSPGHRSGPSGRRVARLSPRPELLMSSYTQLQFDFNASATGRDGLRAWEDQCKAASAALGQRIGLPLGHRVEVRLADGVILQGRLDLHDETLFIEQVDVANLELRVGEVNFRRSEIEACVRLD